MGSIGDKLLLLVPGSLHRPEGPAGEPQVEQEQQPKGHNADACEPPSEPLPRVRRPAAGKGHEPSGPHFPLREEQALLL